MVGLYHMSYGGTVEFSEVSRSEVTAFPTMTVIFHFPTSGMNVDVCMKANVIMSEPNIAVNAWTPDRTSTPKTKRNITMNRPSIFILCVVLPLAYFEPP